MIVIRRLEYSYFYYESNEIKKPTTFLEQLTLADNLYWAWAKVKKYLSCW